MDSYSQYLCAETKKSFLDHLWLIQTNLCVLPKRINNIKKIQTLQILIQVRFIYLPKITCYTIK